MRILLNQKECVKMEQVLLHVSYNILLHMKFY